MANSDTIKAATTQGHESYADDAKARRVLVVGSSGTVASIIRLRENKAGSAGTGSDGDTNRVYTLTTSNSVDIIEVFLDGVLLIEITDYTIDNSTKQVTMLRNVFDSQTLSIFYLV